MSARPDAEDEEVPLDVALERLRTLMARFLAEEYVERFLEAAAPASEGGDR